MLMHTKLIVREWLTICQAADTEQCDSQEEQHSDVLQCPERDKPGIKNKM